MSAPTAEEKRLLGRIKAAKSDRSRHAAWINETLRLTLPTYRRIDEGRTPDGRINEQDDLFDTTGQITLEDFASDMISTFTPRHERWVTFEPAEDLDEGQKKEIQPQLDAIGKAIFAEIERSNYWDAAQECFAFWGVSAMAMAISDMGALNPLHFQPIELANLLMERGADGSVTGKWRELSLTPLEQHQLWGQAFPDAFPPPKPGEPERKVKCFEGCDRDWSMPGVERWNWRIVVQDRIKVSEQYEGPGSCPVLACRFRQQADSAWGPGPAHKATPVMRVLDELAYLNLKGLGRSIDPPFSYEEDGLANFEGGMEPGMGYARATGSEPPEAFLPEARFDAVFFERERMEKAIKRAMYQDRPEQPGDTPPTATQWVDEKAWNTRRKELPRDRCVREWVLPIIERVAWIKSQRGELPPVTLKGGRVVNVRPISPLTKAKDLEDINITAQVLGLATQIATAAQGVPAINVRDTIANIKATAKEKHIVLLTDEQLQQAAAIAAEGMAA